MGEEEKEGEGGGCEEKHRSCERGGEKERGSKKRGKDAINIKSNPGFIFGQTELRRDKVGKKEKEGEWGERKSNPVFVLSDGYEAGERRRVGRVPSKT